MAFAVFIDGAEGTTGLKIHERFLDRHDIELLSIDPSFRKDAGARGEMIRAADVAFLCLPDVAAREAVALAGDADTILIDTSTAHRVAPGWAYGFPELSPAHRAAIGHSKRIAVPGCHATGLIAIVYPLIALGILPRDYPVTAHSITGYSGGGKKMIAQYESADREASLDSPRQYALSLKHKHLPEMTQISGLSAAPIFNPIVCDFYAGMAVSVPIYAAMLNKKLSPDDVAGALGEYYAGQTFISVSREPEDGFIPANGLAGTNQLHIDVCGNDRQMTLVSTFDNLGKGASGAAMQAMNIALGLPEHIGLV